MRSVADYGGDLTLTGSEDIQYSCARENAYMKHNDQFMLKYIISSIGSPDHIVCCLAQVGSTGGSRGFVQYCQREENIYRVEFLNNRCVIY